MDSISPISNVMSYGSAANRIVNTAQVQNLAQNMNSGSQAQVDSYSTYNAQGQQEFGAGVVAKTLDIVNSGVMVNPSNGGSSNLYDLSKSVLSSVYA